MGKMELTKRIMIVTRATAMTLITLIYMRTDKNGVDGNVEDAYANDVDHDDDN